MYLPGTIPCIAISSLYIDDHRTWFAKSSECKKIILLTSTLKTHKQLETLCMSWSLAFIARSLGTPQVTLVVAEKTPPGKELYFRCGSHFDLLSWVETKQVNWEVRSGRIEDHEENSFEILAFGHQTWVVNSSLRQLFNQLDWTLTLRGELQPRHGVSKATETMAGNWVADFPNFCQRCHMGNHHCWGFGWRHRTAKLGELQIPIHLPHPGLLLTCLLYHLGSECHSLLCVLCWT